MTQRPQIAVVIPEEDALDSGGSVSRWVSNVYSDPVFSDYEVAAYGRFWGTGVACALASVRLLRSRRIYALSRFLPRLDLRLDGWLYLLAAFSRIRNSDLIHVHGRPHYALILRQLGYRGRLITHSHRDESATGSDFLATVAGRSDTIVFCSKAQRDACVARCPEIANSSITIYNGADPGIFRPRPEVGKDSESLLFVGNLEEYKGIHLLLDAYSSLVGRVPRAKLRIAARNNGSPSALRALARIAALQGKGFGVEYLGEVTHEAGLPELMARSEILCVPSLCEEAFPLVVIEAMLSGTAVVATRSGGVPEALLDTGLTTDKAPHAYSEAIFSLLTASSYRQQIAEQALVRARTHFIWNRVANEMRALVRETLGGR